MPIHVLLHHSLYLRFYLPHVWQIQGFPEVNYLPDGSPHGRHCSWSLHPHTDAPSKFCCRCLPWCLPWISVVQEQPGSTLLSRHSLLPGTAHRYLGKAPGSYSYQYFPWKAIHDPFRLFPFVPGLLLSPHLSEEAHLQNVLRSYYRELHPLHVPIQKSKIFFPVLWNKEW